MCVTVMLLFTVAHSKRSCDYSVIISTYKALILVELQTLNLTGSFDITKEKNHCPEKVQPEKVRCILRYIYRMTQIFNCLSDSRMQQRSDRMTEVVKQMQRLLTQDCLKPQKLGKKAACKPVKKRRGRQRQRRKQMRMIINSWQRLLSITAY